MISWRTDATDYHDYLERMNTHTYELIDAALRHPHLTVDVWGPHWAGYDPTLPVSTNLKRRAWRVYRLEQAKREWTEAVRLYELDVAEREKRVEEKRWWSWADIRHRPVQKVEQVAMEADDERPVGPGEWVQPVWEVKDGDGECHESLKWDVAWTIS